MALAHSKDQGYIQFDSKISRMVTDTANITVAIKYDVVYELSISIFRMDIGLF